MNERTLDTLAEGERAVVSRLAEAESPQALRLLTLGLAPGVPVRVEQRYPAVVVLIDETLVALEDSVARSIFVRDGLPGEYNIRSLTWRQTAI